MCGEQFFNLADFAVYLFCVLRTNDRAFSAQNAFIGNDLCLMIFVFYSLYRALPQTLETILAFCKFKIQIFHKFPLSIGRKTAPRRHIRLFSIMQ